MSLPDHLGRRGRAHPLDGALPRALPIAFDRRKYGRPLQVDACAVASIPGFIKTPQAHRLGFHEIALVTSGRGRLELDGSTIDVAPYRLCLTRAGETRRWRLEGDRLDAVLAFFEADFLDDFFADPGFVERLPVVAGAPAQRSIPLSHARFDALMSVVGAMTDELGALRDDSHHLLRAQLYRLLVMVQRESGVAPPPEVDPSLRLALRFSELVAGGLRAGAVVADYAQSLGTTRRSLDRALQHSCGRSATDLIQQRLLLESRRLLLQSELSVAAIAERLDFSDASYFSRFFKRHLGLPPGRFRQRYRSAARGTNVHCEDEVDR